jgi:hypothetical protein
MELIFMVGHGRIFEYLNDSNWNLKASNIATAALECPMNDGLNSWINCKHVEFISVHVTLALLQWTWCLCLTILFEDVVARTRAIDANPWNLYSVDVRFHVRCEGFN